MTGDAVPPLTGGALTRARILDAAAHLLSTVGISRTTTKQIAREAGCSEAALYKHFRDKEEIFMRVLHERAPRFSDALARLPGRAGTGDPAEHLAEVVRCALPFFRQSLPMAGSLLASPELLANYRRKLALTAAGPHQATALLSRYLRLEQRGGRISAGIDPEAAAMLLIGACFHRAFLDCFYGPEPPPGRPPVDDEEFVTEVVRALLAGVAPGTENAATGESEPAGSAAGTEPTGTPSDAGVAPPDAPGGAW